MGLRQTVPVGIARAIGQTCFGIALHSRYFITVEKRGEMPTNT